MCSSTPSIRVTSSRWLTVAVADSGKTVTGAPYTATASTETTQVLADGNRIVNKTESQLARDGQGRTRRQEVMSNVGPLATNAPKMAFINDPVANAHLHSRLER